VANVNKGTELALTDQNGKILWRKVAEDDYGTAIPAAQFARGIYLLHATIGRKKLISIKLTRL